MNFCPSCANRAAWGFFSIFLSAKLRIKLYKCLLLPMKAVEIHMCGVRHHHPPAHQAVLHALAHHFLEQSAKYLPERGLPTSQLRNRTVVRHTVKKVQAQVPTQPTSVWILCSICRFDGIPYRKPTSRYFTMTTGAMGAGRISDCTCGRVLHTRMTGSAQLSAGQHGVSARRCGRRYC